MQAYTRLYEWRGRNFTALSDSDGEADLQVEVLSHVPVTYQFSVPPVVVAGVYYESLESIELTLPPGTTTVPTVTLTVRASLGSIAGHVESVSTPLEVWIVQSPSGFTRTVSTSMQGDFSLGDLPVGEYLVTFDPAALASLGLSLPAQRVDLSAELSAQVQFQPEPLPGDLLSGVVTAEDGAWLPFAWVAAADQVGQLDPDQGTYLLVGLPESDVEVVVSAPGFYSQARPLQEPPVDFSLVFNPEMGIFPWGAGSLFLPPETVASGEGLLFDFTQGWMWGQGGGAEQPLVLLVDDVRIEIASGRFALERIPAQAAWFYLFEGTASVQPSDGAALDMTAGQMLRIFDSDPLQAVAYKPAVVRALNPVKSSPLVALWQPTLWQRIESGIEIFGVGSAKVVTFVTYLVIIISLLAIPLSGVYWWLKKRQKRR